MVESGYGVVAAFRIAQVIEVLASDEAAVAFDEAGSAEASVDVEGGRADGSRSDIREWCSPLWLGSISAEGGMLSCAGMLETGRSKIRLSIFPVVGREGFLGRNEFVFHRQGKERAAVRRRGGLRHLLPSQGG